MFPQPPRTAAVWVIGTLGVAAAVCSFALILASSDELAPGVHASLVAWIIVAYVLCGLFAWWQRPDSRFGPLMVVAGFAPFLSTLSVSDAAVPQTIGDVCRRLPPAVFLHLFLSYPTGRLRGRVERTLVATTYGVVLGVGLVPLALGGGGSHDLLVLGSRPIVADLVSRAQGVGIFLLLLAAIGLFVARWRRSGRVLRRTGSLVLGTFLTTLVVLAIGGLLTAQAGSTVHVRWLTFGLIALAPLALVSRLVGARLARSSVGDLFVELRADPAPADLQVALARAVGDPSLTLAYWVPDFRTYVDLDGRPADVEATVGRAKTLIERNGVLVAALVHDPALADEPQLLEAVTAAAGIALENARLHAELRARLEELQGSRARIVEAGRTERKRLERNLHDGAQQRLIALSLELRLLENELVADPHASTRLAQARHEIAASLDELREVARGLHPAVVSGHGLAVALEQLVARADVPVRLTIGLGARVPEPLEVVAYYLVAESLTNIGKYARASSATVEVTRRAHDVLVEVVDDGVGGADESRGSGLRGLADRVEALGGTLRVWSPAGGGTKVRAELPCVP